MPSNKIAHIKPIPEIKHILEHTKSLQDVLKLDGVITKYVMVHGTFISNGNISLFCLAMSNGQVV